jgi:hypothetical protein
MKINSASYLLFVFIACDTRSTATLVQISGDVSAVRVVFAIMFHSYDYISLFASFINIPVRLGRLLHG